MYVAWNGNLRDDVNDKPEYNKRILALTARDLRNILNHSNDVGLRK